MWKATLLVLAALSMLVSDAVANGRLKREEAQQIAQFSDKVSRQGKELFFRLNDGVVVSRKDSRPSAGYHDCDGNVSVSYRFIDFIDPWFVVHNQLYEGSATEVINRDTGEAKDVHGYAEFAPDKTRFIATGHPSESPFYLEIWKLSRSGPVMEWQTSRSLSLRWYDPTTVEVTDDDDATATLKHDGTSWKCSGSRQLCDDEMTSGEHRTKRIHVPREDTNWQLLESAVRRGDGERIKALLDSGADVNPRGSYGWTVLQRGS